MIPWTQDTWGKDLLEEGQETREGQVTWAWHKDGRYVSGVTEGCQGGDIPQGQHSVSSRENLKRQWL